MNGKGLFRAVTVVALLGGVSGTAWAGKDTLKVKVNAVAPSIVALHEGGATLSEGVYSTSSAIKVDYTYVGYTFPSTATVFGSFTAGLAIDDHSADSGQDTNYQLSVSLGQLGSGHNLQLTPSPNSVNFLTAAATGSSTVTVTIDCTVAGGCPSTDGSSISGQLMFTGPGGCCGLDTSVKVQVTITLVHPTECVKLYDFLTSQDLVSPADSTEVVYVKKGPNTGKVNATTPYGQLSDNVLVANTCEGVEMFDVLITLDPSFETNPHDNPGNAVFSYLAGEVVEPGTFDIGQFGGETPRGQVLCLSNVTLPGTRSFLATVHMGIQRGIQVADLDPTGTFKFKAELYAAGSICSGASSSLAAVELPFTLK